MAVLHADRKTKVVVQHNMADRARYVNRMVIVGTDAVTLVRIYCGVCVCVVWCNSGGEGVMRRLMPEVDSNAGVV